MNMRTRCTVFAIIVTATILVPTSSGQNFSAWSAPVNLGAPINTISAEVDPFLARDGMTLYFNCQCPDSLGGFDIYFSEWDSEKGQWGAPQHLPAPINSDADDSNPAITMDGHRMYFASTRPGGMGGPDIYVVRRRDKRNNQGWGDPENLGPAVNTSASENAPFLFEDEARGVTSLYFVSNRADSLGDDDIYSVEMLPDGTFGAVSHVWELSTEAADRHPNLRRDGLEIFFMSNRPGSIVNAKGAPSFDLWTSTRASTSDAWSEPVNVDTDTLGQLVPNINTGRHDARPSLSFDGTALYFMSAQRPGNQGATCQSNPFAATCYFDIWVATREKIKGEE